MLKYFCLIFFVVQLIKAQDVIGYWKTVDDQGIAKSVVEIYKTDNGLVEGKIHRILKPSERDRLCKQCKGDKKDKPIEGMVIIEDMQKNGSEYSDGEITDPEKGKTYDCKMWIDEDNPDILHVRGYVAFFYRTQDWVRAEE